MESIHDGLIYDTEKSIMIASLPAANYDYNINLHITINGRWFKAIPVLNQIVPLTDAEAMSLLESYGKNGLLKIHFGNKLRDA